MLAISRRYTSGAKSAWKADFHPDVTRPETGSGENGDWMRKMEIGGGERSPEGLQRVSEVARAGGLACWRGPRGLAGWREQRELASRWEGPVGRQAAALDVRRGYARLCAVSLSSRSGCRSAVGGCGGRGVGVACSRRSFGEAFRRSRTSIRIGGLQIRGS